MNFLKQLMTFLVLITITAHTAAAIQTNPFAVQGSEIDVQDAINQSTNDTQAIQKQLDKQIEVAESYLSGVDELQRGTTSVLQAAQQYTAKCKRIESNTVLTKTAYRGFKLACEIQYAGLQKNATTILTRVDNMMAFIDTAKEMVSQAVKVKDALKGMDSFTSTLGKLDDYSQPMLAQMEQISEELRN